MSEMNGMKCIWWKWMKCRLYMDWEMSIEKRDNGRQDDILKREVEKDKDIVGWDGELVREDERLLIWMRDKIE